MLTKKSPSSTEWVKSSHSLNTEREKAIYNMGKERGAEEVWGKFEETNNENFLKSYNDTTKVLELLKKEKIEIISARLKVEPPNCLKVMLSVKDEGDTVLNLEKIYDYLYELEELSNTDDYFINFSIIKANKNFTDSRVESDGYIYKHRLLVNEEEPRTA